MPHGGKLKRLMVSKSICRRLKEEAASFPSLTLNERQLCDLELLLNGGFSPLSGFMTRDDYESVLSNMRLTNGLIWPMPITLDIDKKQAEKFKAGGEIGLYDAEGCLLALLQINDIWKPDKIKEALAVYGTTDKTHSGVHFLLSNTGDYYLGGEITGISEPYHYDFLNLRKTPRQLRREFAKKGWHKVVAFQTRNPMHKAHQEITKRAVQEVGAKLLIHPVVGLTKPGDIDYVTRIRCYQKILSSYPKESVVVSLLPLAMRMAGPREVLWHAIIRKNYGCSHFIVGRDHAEPGNDKNGKPFYSPYEVQELLEKYQKELGVGLVKMKEMNYVPKLKKYLSVEEIPKGAESLHISGTELRRRLQDGEEIPEWFSFPEILEELKNIYSSKNKKGFAVLLTGFSGSGKSTISRYLQAALNEDFSARRVTLLDGDIIRRYLSGELGFSKEHRDLNVLRTGFVASEIVKHGGIAIMALIAPYQKSRDKVRQLVNQYGEFIEIHISTPLKVCESRDRKGLYAKARKGIIKGFTGIDDPYEKPLKPEIKIDTSRVSPKQAVNKVMSYVKQKKYL